MDLETLFKRADFEYGQPGGFALGENESCRKLRPRHVIYILDGDLIGDRRAIH